MIDGYEPLSCILWAVVAFAAGMYPLGFMLGGACSECCEKACEPLFYRCLRFKSVEGSVPITPSRFIYRLADAGIVKGSSTTSATMTLGVNGHPHLLGVNVSEYKVDLKAYKAGGAACVGIQKEYTIRVEGRDFPLAFGNLSLPDQYAGQPLDATGVAGANVEVAVNIGATVSATVVAATARNANGSGEPSIDGTELTEAILKGMLTVSAPRFPTSSFGGAAVDPKIDVTLSGAGSIFRYITTPVLLSWVVRVNRGTTQRHFTVTAQVWPDDPEPLPEGGVAPLALPPLPTNLTNTPEPPILPPVVNGTTITIKANRNQNYNFTLPVTLDLSGPCTIDVSYLAFDQPKNQTGLEPPAALGLAFLSQTAPASHPLDIYVFRYIDDARGSGENYDVEQVKQYRAGERAMTITHQSLNYAVSPPSTITKTFSLLIAEPSPMCGQSMCSLPQELLPSGITYEPAEGVMWECKPARTIVLGNPIGGCLYSHETNECRGFGGASVYLYEFFTGYPMPFSLTNSSAPTQWVPPDALTWLEFVEEAQPLAKADGTYTIGGQYDPADGRYGACYGSFRQSFFGSSVFDREFVGSAWRGGVCPPSQYTLTISDVRIADESNTWSQPDTYLEGDYVLDATKVSCDRASYGFYTEIAGPLPSLDILSIDLNVGVDFSPGVAWIEVSQVPVPPDTCLGKIYVGLHWSYRKGNVTGYAFAWNPSFPTFGDGAMESFGTPIIWSRASGQLAPVQTATLDAQPSDTTLSQCSGVTFSPTSVVLPAQPDSASIPSLGVAAEDKPPADIAASGPASKCGYGFLLGQIGDGRYATALSLGQFFSIVWPSAVDPSKTMSQKRWLVSDGSTPQEVTIELPGRCYSIGVMGGLAIPVQASVTSASRDGQCISIAVVPAGQDCEWTATSNVDWIMLNEEAADGKGVQNVEARVAAMPEGVYQRTGVVTIALDVNATIKATVTINQF